MRTWFEETHFWFCLLFCFLISYCYLFAVPLLKLLSSLFSVEKKFERKTFSSVVSVFFSFSWNCPLRAECKSAELVACLAQAQKVTAVWELETAGTRYLLYFDVFLDDTLLQVSVSLTTKTRVFRQTFMVFSYDWACFSKTSPFAT